MKTNDLFLNAVYERIDRLEKTLRELENGCHFDDAKNAQHITHCFQECNIALSDSILYSSEHNREFKDEVIKNLYDCLNLCRNHSYASEVFNETVHMDYHSDEWVYIHFENEK